MFAYGQTGTGKTHTGADGGGMAWPAPERRRVFKLVEVSEDIVGKTKIFAVSQNTERKSHRHCISVPDVHKPH